MIPMPRISHIAVMLLVADAVEKGDIEPFGNGDIADSPNLAQFSRTTEETDQRWNDCEKRDSNNAHGAAC
jgi:hypothetical protein